MVAVPFDIVYMYHRWVPDADALTIKLGRFKVAGAVGEPVTRVEYTMISVLPRTLRIHTRATWCNCILEFAVVEEHRLLPCPPA